MSGGVLRVCTFQVSTPQRPSCSPGLRFRGISRSVSPFSHAGFSAFHLITQATSPGSPLGCSDITGSPRAQSQPRSVPT